ncbi:hypothetical protein [Embleya sp. NBC_00896]|uniref:hypothetical protein n=1 Tax=Embleya sp. NBC_00896 TaxID=2975961 RepID=UPI003868C8B1|nr:hypothetical protein OG928_02885 [Embleya sp. NBC_00896]
MIEYEMFKARQRDILATADHDRLVVSALRARRAEAKARRAERVEREAVAGAAAQESGRMRRNLQLLTR